VCDLETSRIGAPYIYIYIYIYIYNISSLRVNNAVVALFEVPSLHLLIQSTQMNSFMFQCKDKPVPYE